MVDTAQNDSFQATDAGFRITHERQRSDFRDQDVLGIRVATRRQLDMLGNLTLQESLHVRLRDEQGDHWIDMVAEVGPWDQDPLQELRERLLNNLLERSCESLLKAGDVTGAGWSLSLIHFTDLASGRSCPPQEISAVRWCDDQLCVFHEDQDSPIARFPRDAENTILLYRLFEQLLEGVCHPPNDTAPSTGLGALQKQVTATERRWLSPRRFATLSSVPVAALLYALPLNIAAIGIALLLLTFLVVMPLLTGTPATLRLYERAIVWTRGSDERVLLLEQLRSLTAIHTEDGQSNQAATPRLTLSFDCDHRDRSSFQFQTILTAENRELLESMVIDVATLLATNLREHLNRHGHVAWTEQITIFDDSIVCQPQIDGPPQRIPRTDIQGWTLSDTKLTIVLPTGDAISLSTSCPNFYTGLLLLHERGWFKSSRRVARHAAMLTASVATCEARSLRTRP